MKDQLPYIGVTGFTTRDQVERAINKIPLNQQRRQLMVGVLASDKSMRHLPLQPHWQAVMPDPHAIKAIFCDHPMTCNLVHLSTSEDEPESLLDDMLDLHTIVGDKLDGFQLNVAWPDPRLLDVYRQRYDESRLVLQIGRRALEMIGPHPHDLVSKLKDYAEFGAINDILLDASGGKGELFNLERSQRLLNAIEDSGFGLEIGLAGGLGPNTLDRLVLVLHDHPHLSIDAEGQLREGEFEGVKGCLNRTSVDQYLERAFALCAKYQ